MTGSLIFPAVAAAYIDQFLDQLLLEEYLEIQKPRESETILGMNRMKPLYRFAQH